MSDAHQGESDEQADASPKPPVVDGITAPDFALWRHQPVTRMFLKYLRDRRTDFAAGITDQWLAGEVELSTEHEARGFAKCLSEVVDTRLANIDLFYKQLKMIGEAQNGGDDNEAEEDGGRGQASPAS